jgi:hypothetical protein
MPGFLRLRGDDVAAFLPAIVSTRHQPPSPLPRMTLYAVLALIVVMLVWACVGRLDIVAVAQGKLVPQSFLKIVQPSESGIVKEILVKEGDAVREGQVLARMDTRLSEADSRILQGELNRKRLQVRRIEAELTGAPMKRLADDPVDIYSMPWGPSRRPCSRPSMTSRRPPKSRASSRRRSRSTRTRRSPGTNWPKKASQGDCWRWSGSEPIWRASRI